MTKAIILAAGEGRRLKPLTMDRPKGMVHVVGRPIIERQLRLFRQAQIEEIAIVKGFCGESVPDYGVRHYTNKEYSTTNMVHSLFCAEDELASGDVIVSYGDILYSPGVLRGLQESKGQVSVVVDLHWYAYFSQRFDDPFSDAESLVMDDRGLITSIGQEQPHPDDVQAQYIGLMKFDAEGIASIRRIREVAAKDGTTIGWGRPLRTAFMTDLLQELVHRDVAVRAVPIRGGWCEIDSLRDHQLAERMVPSLSTVA